MSPPFLFVDEPLWRIRSPVVIIMFHIETSKLYPECIPILSPFISPFISPFLLQSTHKSWVNRTTSKAQDQLRRWIGIFNTKPIVQFFQWIGFKGTIYRKAAYFMGKIDGFRFRCSIHFTKFKQDSGVAKTMNHHEPVFVAALRIEHLRSKKTKPAWSSPKKNKWTPPLGAPAGSGRSSHLHPRYRGRGTVNIAGVSTYYHRW